jgi:hypothetical protein
MASFSSREIKALILIPLAYIAGWSLCIEEIRYWLRGRDVIAQVVDRHEYEIERGKRAVKMVKLTYSFADPESGAERTESLDLRIGTLTDYSEPQLAIQYLPGIERASRLPYALSRYFAVVFLAGNALLAIVAFWVWRMVRDDTWAWKPGRR